MGTGGLGLMVMVEKRVGRLLYAAVDYLGS